MSTFGCAGGERPPRSRPDTARGALTRCGECPFRLTRVPPAADNRPRLGTGEVRHDLPFGRVGQIPGGPPRPARPLSVLRTHSPECMSFDLREMIKRHQGEQFSLLSGVYQPPDGEGPEDPWVRPGVRAGTGGPPLGRPGQRLSRHAVGLRSVRRGPVPPQGQGGHPPVPGPRQSQPGEDGNAAPGRSPRPGNWWTSSPPGASTRSSSATPGRRPSMAPSSSPMPSPGDGGIVLLRPRVPRPDPRDPGRQRLQGVPVGLRGHPGRRDGDPLRRRGAAGGRAVAGRRGGVRGGARHRPRRVHPPGRLPPAGAGALHSLRHPADRR